MSLPCLCRGMTRQWRHLLELERNPRPWRKGLYVDPSSYAQIGGWTFDKEGHRTQLNFDTCYPMVKGAARRGISLSASAAHGRTPAPTAAGGWWTCWCWTAGMSG